MKKETQENWEKDIYEKILCPKKICAEIKRNQEHFHWEDLIDFIRQLLIKEKAKDYQKFIEVLNNEIKAIEESKGAFTDAEKESVIIVCNNIKKTLKDEK